MFLALSDTASFNSNTTLTNRPLSVVEKTQAMVWYGSLLAASGKATAAELLDAIAVGGSSKVMPELHEVRRLEEFAVGKRRPSMSRGIKTGGPWLHATGTLWPNTRRWFDTPVWYLLDRDDVTYQELMDCAQLLPTALREGLFWNPESADPSALDWRPVTRATIYSLIEKIDEWELGAGALGLLACAMRDAELRGEAGMVRWSAVGLTWAAYMLQSMAHPAMRAGLLQIDAFVGEYLRRRDKPGVFLGKPVSVAEVKRFHRERQIYLDCVFSGVLADEDADSVAPWLRIE